MTDRLVGMAFPEPLEAVARLLQNRYKVRVNMFICACDKGERAIEDLSLTEFNIFHQCIGPLHGVEFVGGGL